MWLLLLVGIGIVGLGAYLYVKYIFSHWARHGFPYWKPVRIPFGSMKAYYDRERSFGLAIRDIYLESKEPFIGIYAFTNPAVLIRDIDLVKRVLVTDFDYFHDRNVYVNKEREPLSAELFSLKGVEWKNLRRKFNPLFSSGKLKAVFPTILAEVNNMEKYVEKHAQNGILLENKEMMFKYTINIIASVMFGVDVDTIAEPDHPFAKMFKIQISPSFTRDIINVLSFIAPKLIDLLHLPLIPEGVKNFFLTVVHSTIKYRTENNIRRNDFMQLMIDLHNNTTDSDMSFTINEITANCIIFYTAGADTSPTTTSCALYEMALQPNIMKKVQEEVDDILGKYNGEITYDGIQEMVYLDMCIKETLRKYPGLPLLLRECTKDYQIPGSDLTIKKGTSVFVSAIGLQSDEKYFPNPFEFNPEHFRKGQETYPKEAYIPFGDGPRQCIAVRMGLMIIKAALVKLLSKYDFETVDKKPIEIDNYSVGVAAKGELLLRVTTRKNLNNE